MKLEYTPPDGAPIKLHELGTLYIVGEESAFTPEEFPQRETRIMRVRCEFWENTYKRNRALVEQLRQAMKLNNGKLKWQGEDELDENLQVIGDGQIYMDNYVEIVEVQWPDGNTWGETEQFVTFAFRYNVMDLVSDKTHLQASFQILHAVSGSPVVLGNVFVFKDNYRQTRYSELKGIRDRASGNLILSGEFQSDRNATAKVRRIALRDKLAEMRSQVQGQSGRLKYGPSDCRLFDADVKVDAFDADIDQANWVIKWSMTVSYTVFPNEAGYAASDFKVEVGDEEESGDQNMTLSGTVAAATEQIAIAKLGAVRTAALAANGFTLSRRIAGKLEKGFLNNDDTQNVLFNPANSALSPPNVFITLTFNETYRKRMANVLSYTLQIVDNDDTRSGLITRTYSGGVVSSGATADIAYNTASGKARELGDNKHDYRMSGRITRNDRKMTDAPQEHVRIEFNYDYQLKGERIWLELTADETHETFGDNTIKVSGFVVAKDRATAEEAYNSQVLALYGGQLIRSSGFSENRNIIETGNYAPTWVGSGAFTEMFIRLDFNLVVWKPKTAGTYAIKFGVQIETDFVKLTKSAAVIGTFYGGPDVLSDVENAVGGNKLDTFMSAFGFGKLLKTNRTFAKEKVGDDILAQLSVEFTNAYMDKLSTAQQILECSISEEIVYSNVRWNFAPLPDGPSVPQDCGIEPGTRTLSGSVTAATETAAMVWVKKVKGTPFPSGTGGGAAPSERYEGAAHVTRNWEFLPLEDGVARGSGANAMLTKASFSFPETLVDYPWRDN